jgi:hypothetical protein
MEEGVHAVSQWTTRRRLNLMSSQNNSHLISTTLMIISKLFGVMFPLFTPIPDVAGKYQHPDDFKLPGLVFWDSSKIQNGNATAENVLL